MNLSQQQIDDLLEDLIALTDTPDRGEQVKRLSRLCLLLIEQIDDHAAVRRALDIALSGVTPLPVRPIP
jgi:hypothetical protein